jgi:hypothetical protein
MHTVVVIVDCERFLLPRFASMCPNYDRSFNDASPSLRINRSYAFVEFRSQRDAEDAYYDMYVLPLYISKSATLTMSSAFFSLGMDGNSRVRDLVFR